MPPAVAHKHPAKFNTDVLAVISEFLDHERVKQQHGLVVLDPFAGVGGIHTLNDPPQIMTRGLELEPEWARQHVLTLVGDVLTYDFRRMMTTYYRFDVIATSPCYGNRMADHQDAKEICRECKGTGFGEEILTTQEWSDGIGYQDYKVTICKACDGKGHREYERITYKHKLGRDLSPNSSAGLQWGAAYKAFHVEAYTRLNQLLTPEGLFILNMKDHVRDKKVVPVTQWHVDTLYSLGFTMQTLRWVPTKSMKRGQNYAARLAGEWVMSLRKGRHPLYVMPDTPE
jgi:hypothetical protein